jgi:hypothetical protein
MIFLTFYKSTQVPLQILFVIAAVFISTLSGCAATTFETSGSAPRQALCESRGEAISALVLWGARWRADQKDVPLREAATRQGIEQFFAESGCYSRVRVLRDVGGRPALELSQEEVRQVALGEELPPSRVLTIVVRELGPVVKLLGSAALVEGGTEVVLDIKAQTLDEPAPVADFSVHWKNGGPGVIKGVATLADDMGSALQAALQPESQ